MSPHFASCCFPSVQTAWQPKNTHREVQRATQNGERAPPDGEENLPEGHACTKCAELEALRTELTLKTENKQLQTENKGCLRKKMAQLEALLPTLTLRVGDPSTDRHTSTAFSVPLMCDPEMGPKVFQLNFVKNSCALISCDDPFIRDSMLKNPYVAAYPP